MSVDVADREAVVDGFGGIVAERGEVDVLVTSAGITRPGRFTELSDEVWEAVLDLLAGRYPSEEFAELRPRVVWDRGADLIRGRAGAQRVRGSWRATG